MECMRDALVLQQVGIVSDKRKLSAPDGNFQRQTHRVYDTLRIEHANAQVPPRLVEFLQRVGTDVDRKTKFARYL